MTWHDRDADSVLAELGTSAVGLDAREVARRRAQYGPNAQPEPPVRSRWALLLGQVASPLIYLLIVAAAIAVALGDVSDAVVILAVVALNAIIGALQEGRAESALLALRRMTAAPTRVVRDGTEQTIDARELVPGDVIVISAGDAISADARLIDDASLQVAEAALTGESTPVAKSRAPVPSDAALAERSSMVHGGTLVTAGRARAVVVATGARSEIGRIAALASGTRPPPTPLERRIHQLGRYVSVAAVGVLIGVVALGRARGMPVAEIAMLGISQMVGMIPEGLPIAMTIGLAVGVQRMAARGAIVRRLAAVETLGATTVICSDKTGTLTRNEMTVAAIHVPGVGELEVEGSGYEPRGAFSADGGPALVRLLEACVLCSDADVAQRDGRWVAIGDPTEAALVTVARKGGVDAAALRAGFPREHEIPFDAAAKLMATQHRRNGRPFVLVKGAPEVVRELCGDGGDDAHAAADAMARRALRVLAIAIVEDAELGSIEALRGRATLLGLAGQIDPPRDEVIDAIATCRTAGIRVVMLTGDHAATALAIARQLGIAGEGDVAIDGRELAAMDDEALGRALARVRVFARVQPDQKLRVVEACQRRRDVVAVTGDGVNDAPALVRADVGVAMGITGTEVAKEAAKIVVTDDNFATIGAAVEEGRVVYRNIKKAVLLLCTTSLAEVVILVGAMAIGLPAPFMAVQILWNNLVTEGVITVNLVMEPAEGDEMRRPPIAVDEPLLTRAMLSRLFLLSLVTVVIVLGWFAWRLDHGVPVANARSEAFTLLVVCEWFNVLNCLSDRRSALRLSILRNRWLLGGLVVGNLLQIAVVFVPALNRVFYTAPLDIGVVAAIGVAGSAVLWIEELRKLIAARA